MAGINRKSCFIIAGITLMLLPLAGVAILLLDQLNRDEPEILRGTRQFQTSIILQATQTVLYETDPIPPLFYENVSDGGSRTINCYPTLSPTTTYIFWNVDRSQSESQTLLPYIHAYNRDFFQAGESVEITVYRPDRSVYLQQSVTAPVPPLAEECEIDPRAVGVSWAFSPDDPAGEWQVEFAGENGREVTYTTQLEPHSEGWISQSCVDNTYTFFLDGFEPAEELHLLLVSIAEGSPISLAEVETVLRHHWQIQVDDLGQLRVQFGEDVDATQSTYLLVERVNGDIIGQRQPLLIEASLNRFHTCQDEHFEPAIPDAPTVIPEVPATLDLPACPDAPPARFAIGETVTVDFKDIGALKIRTAPDYQNAPALEQAYDGDQLLLLEGPVCDPAGDRWTWRVRLLRTGTEGWAAEGVTDDNWMCPLSDPDCGS